MVKASWGSKRTCPCGNGVRFYDLNKKEIECPGCGENINVEQLSISTLENNLRKKSQTQIIEEKRIKVDKKPPKILWDYETFTLPGRADKTKMTK